MKFEDLTQRYTNLEQEHRATLAKNDTQAQQMLVLQQTADKEKAAAAAYEEQLKRECEDARVEVEDLSDLVKTKDRMLEDQVITITDFKEKIKEKEDEIKQLNDSKNKYRDFYEEKLQQEYEENEKARAKTEEAQGQLQNLEYDLE